jgi:hypothetical protein
MTATDWLEVAADMGSNSTSAFAITVTMASGYLVMAYIVGKKLSVAQLWVFNTLFLIAMVLVALGDFQSLTISVRAMHEAGKLLPDWKGYFSESDNWYTYVSLTVNILMIGGCLKFMWGIRHTEG